MTAADAIRARIAELQGIRERYLAYQQDRVNERDHHGAWDVAVNLSETECEISGLEFALGAIEAPLRAAFAAPRCGMPMPLGLACELQVGHSDCHTSTEGQSRP